MGITLCKSFRYVSRQRVWSFEPFWSQDGYTFGPLWSQRSAEPQERTNVFVSSTSHEYKIKVTDQKISVGDNFTDFLVAFTSEDSGTDPKGLRAGVVI